MPTAGHPASVTADQAGTAGQAVAAGHAGTAHQAGTAGQAGTADQAGTAVSNGAGTGVARRPTTPPGVGTRRAGQHGRVGHLGGSTSAAAASAATREAPSVGSTMPGTGKLTVTTARPAPGVQTQDSS